MSYQSCRGRVPTSGLGSRDLSRTPEPPPCQMLERGPRGAGIACQRNHSGRFWSSTIRPGPCGMGRSGTWTCRRRCRCRCRLCRCRTSLRKRCCRNWSGGCSPSLCRSCLSNPGCTCRCSKNRCCRQKHRKNTCLPDLPASW